MDNGARVRGAAFKTDAKYIINKFGSTALLKVERELSRLGYPLRYNKLKDSMWYDASLRLLSFDVMKKVLKMTPKDFEEMGYSAPGNSLIIRVLLRFLTTLRGAFGKSNYVWHKYYSKGDLIPTKYDLTNRKIILKLSGFKVSSLFISYLQGFLARLFNFMKPHKKVTVDSKKEGEDYIFTIRWKQ